MKPDLLNRAKARAARLGLDRADYIRGLIERDLGEPDSALRSRFASEDLVGRFQLGGASATNARAREALRRRSTASREAHR